MIDEGPFQNITGISFPVPDTPELFVHAENLRIRTDCNDAATQSDPGTQVGRIPNTGTTSILCVCTDPTFSGGYDCFTLRFFIPLTAAWPECVIGASSGGTIKKNWPDVPSGWGGGSPSPISSPSGQCDTPVWYTGQVSGSNYRVQITFCNNCQPSSGAPDDCCG